MSFSKVQRYIVLMSKQGFHNLDPELVLKATELAGFQPTGEFTQLNSYENRVFDIRTEDELQPRVIAKFYRPNRWSGECILEEHAFLQELADEGIPAVTALTQKNSSTLNSFEEMYVAFFPKVLGRMPVEFLGNDLLSVGRRIAQMHNVGAKHDFSYRPVIAEHPWTPWETLDYLSEWVSPEVWSRYEKAAETVIESLNSKVNPDEFIRIHGDCHRGNLLTNDKEFFFVDFDDTCMGPAVQDFWMLFSSLESQKEQELLIQGYEEFREFPYHQLNWIDELRGLRILSYAGWIARRWTDPSFPKIFPDFNSFSYWAEETEALEKIVRNIEK